MLNAHDFGRLLYALEALESLGLNITTTEASIFVVRDGKVINNGFASTSELIGWVQAYKDCKKRII